MKKLLPNLALIFLFTVSLSAQNDLPDLQGWADDEHYILIKDADKGAEEWLQVNAKTGKEEAYTPVLQEDITSALPSNVRANRWNSIYSKDGNKYSCKCSYSEVLLDSDGKPRSKALVKRLDEQREKWGSCCNDGGER